MTATFLALLTCIALSSQSEGVSFRQEAVVSVCPIASKEGAAILRRGGNAVDAAITTALVLAVTHPAAGNIGGGGFMLVDGPGREPEVIDYRETAPGAASLRMFQPGDGGRTAKASGVPGTVAGLAMSHRRHGSLPWRDLVEPAVRVARDGFVSYKPLVDSLNSVLASVSPNSAFQKAYGKPGGGKWVTGDTMVFADLANTLKAIAQEGEAGFYSGGVARAIVSEMQRSGGLISLEDLAGYRAIVREPIKIQYKQHEILALPPPSSGGACLALILGMADEEGLEKNPRDSAVALHLLAESMRRAFRERARHLGDPAFAPIPGFLFEREYARGLAKGINRAQATPSIDLAGDIPVVLETEHTTHFSVADAKGMVVSNTYTLEDSYGSRVVVAGAGFILNNEMQDFNWFPGKTDTKGRIGTSANLISPGKRMLSSQCPVIVRRDGKAVGVSGSPGGRTIPSTVAQVLINKLAYGMTIEDAVAHPRLHHGWFPDEIRFEKSADPRWADTVEALRRLGHKVTGRSQGDAHSLWREGGGWRAGIDRRIAGGASGQ